MGEKLLSEVECILLWCLEGLRRLANNGWKFTISERTRKNMEELRRADNNVLEFLESTGYIRFEAGTHATTKHIYRAYLRWCDDNAEKPLVEKTFSGILRQAESTLHIRYDKNIDVGYGKHARGYHGVHVLVSAEGG